MAPCLPDDHAGCFLQDSLSWTTESPRLFIILFTKYFFQSAAWIYVGEGDQDRLLDHIHEAKIRENILAAGGKWKGKKGENVQKLEAIGKVW